MVLLNPKPYDSYFCILASIQVPLLIREGDLKKYNNKEILENSSKKITGDIKFYNTSDNNEFCLCSFAFVEKCSFKPDVEEGACAIFIGSTVLAKNNEMFYMAGNFNPLEQKNANVKWILIKVPFSEKVCYYQETYVSDFSSSNSDNDFL
ncbi:MAG: hypothetical protein RsTaC01_0818 [Candidatus Paraimprobicoccus trichonymphae]|uniref:Uncharacterized protein n=1 Tax=Candidatus Paraimprobicoccus trichonymphae TaxID=3033793 RepID=A0AA48L1K0_9FIRM|nr:MAG: hypothetical protein RsTaC01_0818 [Candidatus Paraimprobicoccus trichonymphae]